MRCDLILKRTQSSPPRPTFTSAIVATMDGEFEKAAKDYGQWGNLVYSDEQLEVDRDNSIATSDKRRIRANRFANTEGGLLFWTLFGPLILSWKILTLPFKILFWFRRAKKKADTQQCRFSELQQGKSFNSKDLTQVISIEDTIIDGANSVAEYIRAASNHEGDIIFVQRS